MRLLVLFIQWGNTMERWCRTHDGEMGIQLKHLAKDGVKVRRNIVIFIRDLLAFSSLPYLHLDVGVRLEEEEEEEEERQLDRGVTY